MTISSLLCTKGRMAEPWGPFEQSQKDDQRVQFHKIKPTLTVGSRKLTTETPPILTEHRRRGNQPERISNNFRVIQSIYGQPKQAEVLWPSFGFCSYAGMREKTSSQNSHLALWQGGKHFPCGRKICGSGQSIPVQNTQFINAGSTHSSYRLFKEVPLLQGECVSLGDDGDDVDHLTETPHELHIQRPQTEGRRKTLNAQTWLVCEQTQSVFKLQHEPTEKKIILQLNPPLKTHGVCNQKERPLDGTHGSVRFSLTSFFLLLACKSQNKLDLLVFLVDLQKIAVLHYFRILDTLDMPSLIIIIPLSVCCNKANQQKHILTILHYTADLWSTVPADILSSFFLFPPPLLLLSPFWIKKWPPVAPADSLPSCCLPRLPIKPLPSQASLVQRPRDSWRRGLLGSPQRLTQRGTHRSMCYALCAIHSCTKVKANDTLSCATNQR